jgi:AAA+ superfamily predicted ATPase
LLASLRKAVAAMPGDVALRLHLATMLIDAGQRDEGIREVGAILQLDPANAEALALIARAGAGPAGPATDHASGPAAESPAGPDTAGPARPDTDRPARPDAEHPAGSGAGRPVVTGTGDQEFDWRAAESELADVLPPRFVGPDGSASDDSSTGGPGGAGARNGAAPDGPAADGAAPDSAPSGGAAAGGTIPGGGGSTPDGAFDVESAGLRLADVAGMEDVKKRLEAAFLAPMRNPELRRLYGKSLRGGLLMYGPPGCGKTFIARAVAGELGARFLSVSFADVVDSMLGQSERNIHEIFEIARRNAPCVVFLDEVDAIGQKRTQLRHTPMRAVVNQLLLELDDVSGGNEGIFLLAATNHPWDVDSALRRPGRFDRTLLVLPPDQAARAAIFRFHLRERPVERVNLDKLAKLTEGYSGADIAHICESAAELALLDSVRRGEPRMIGQPDLEAAAADIRASLGPWFDAARNVALFANEGGAYDDLAAYLKKRRML